MNVSDIFCDRIGLSFNVGNKLMLLIFMVFLMVVVMIANEFWNRKVSGSCRYTACPEVE